MSKNKVKKTVSLNRTNKDDLVIINKIEQPGFVFNEFAREAMLEKIRRDERKHVQKNSKGGVTIVLKK